MKRKCIGTWIALSLLLAVIVAFMMMRTEHPARPSMLERFSATATSRFGWQPDWAAKINWREYIHQNSNTVQGAFITTLPAEPPSNQKVDPIN